MIHSVDEVRGGSDDWVVEHFLEVNRGDRFTSFVLFDEFTGCFDDCFMDILDYIHWIVGIPLK